MRKNTRNLVAHKGKIGDAAVCVDAELFEEQPGGDQASTGTARSPGIAGDYVLRGKVLVDQTLSRYAKTVGKDCCC